MKCAKVDNAAVTAKIEKMIEAYKGSGSGDMCAAAECLAKIYEIGIENVLAYFGKMK